MFSCNPSESVHPMHVDQFEGIFECHALIAGSMFSHGQKSQYLGPFLFELPPERGIPYLLAHTHIYTTYTHIYTLAQQSDAAESATQTVLSCASSPTRAWRWFPGKGIEWEAYQTLERSSIPLSLQRRDMQDVYIVQVWANVVCQDSQCSMS